MFLSLSCKQSFLSDEKGNIDEKNSIPILMRDVMLTLSTLLHINVSSTNFK